MQSFQRSGWGCVQHCRESGTWVWRQIFISKKVFFSQFASWEFCCLTDGSSAALVAGVLMGLFLLVLLVAAAAVYFFFCYKKSCTENRLRCVFQKWRGEMYHYCNLYSFTYCSFLSRKDAGSSRKRQSAGPLLSAHFDGDQPPELRVSHLSPLV